MKVNEQLHALTTLCPQKELQLHAEWVGLVSEPFWIVKATIKLRYHLGEISCILVIALLFTNLILGSLTFRHRASCILGQAFHYSPENAFYIFNQQIYFII